LWDNPAIRKTPKKGRKIGSVEIIVFHNVLGGFAPATEATPIAISVENRFIMDLWQ